VAREPEWLYATLEVAARADEFTRRLMEVCKAAAADGGPKQALCLGIHRSDYMMHEPEGTAPADVRFLQVELNTVAASFGSLSSRTTDLHRFLLERYGMRGDTAGDLRELYGLSADEGFEGKLPENATLKHIPAAIAKAHELYGAEDASVVFVVQAGERNFSDQRLLEYALWENHRVPVLRKTLGDLHAQGTLDAAGKLLLADTEVSVLYFRAGYTPDDYPTEAEWQGRLLAERSLAIKCPSAAYQLVGAKKVQQALARPGAVERFLGAEAGATLRGCFAGLWGLGPGEDDAEIVAEATRSPAGYVMKPQREGGGNNFYGDDIPKKLEELSAEERGAYILMQRIFPRPQESVLTRSGAALISPALTEFGFYSVFVGDGTTVHMNQHAGHLARTKAEGVDEGGVASGYAVLNSPFLV